MWGFSDEYFVLNISQIDDVLLQKINKDRPNIKYKSNKK